MLNDTLSDREEFIPQLLGVIAMIFLLILVTYMQLLQYWQWSIRWDKEKQYVLK